MGQGKSKEKQISLYLERCIQHSRMDDAVGCPMALEALFRLIESVSKPGFNNKLGSEALLWGPDADTYNSNLRKRAKNISISCCYPCQGRTESEWLSILAPTVFLRLNNEAEEGPEIVDETHHWYL